MELHFLLLQTEILVQVFAACLREAGVDTCTEGGEQHHFQKHQSGFFYVGLIEYKVGPLCEKRDNFGTELTFV